VPGPGQWIGLDRGDTSHEHLEQDLFSVLDAADLARTSYVGTYMIRGDRPHWAASLEIESEVSSLDLARQLAAGLDRLDCRDTHAGVFADPHARRAGSRSADASSFAVLAAAGTEATLGGGEPLRHWAHAAAAALRDRRDTRVVRFPGQDALPAELSSVELAGSTPISDLVGTGVDLSGPVQLHTHGHVRPHFVDGELVLVVMPAGEPGAVRPFELPVPRQCCETTEQFDARWRSYLRTYNTGSPQNATL
jgi:hypothetical protein